MTFSLFRSGARFGSPSLVLLAAIGLMGLSGCDLGGALGVTFDVEIESGVTVEGSPLGVLTGGLGFAGFSGLDFETTQEFENNNTEKALVQSATLKEVTLTVTSPQNGNFDWLNEIAFFVEAPGEDRVRVASATIADGVQEVSLDLESVELAPYVKADSVSFTTEANGSQPSEDHTIEAAIVIEITAGPNG